MPTLRQLEYLVAVAETLHFRRAAERVHTTQPTLSEQLKALEERLGVSLIERSKKKVLLTPVGEQVVRIAQRMLSDAREIRAISTEGRDGLSGVLKFAVPPTIGPYLLPKLISGMQHQHKGLRLYIREVLPNRLLKEVEEGLHDLAITLLPFKRAELVFSPLVEETLYLAVSTDHDFSCLSEISPEALKGVDVLTLSEGHQLHDAVKEVSGQVGANLRSDYEGTSLDTLREMVAMNLGVTFLPGFYVEAIARLDPNIKILDVKGERLSRQIGLVWRRSSANFSGFSTLSNVLRNTIKEQFPQFTILHEPEDV